VKDDNLNAFIIALTNIVSYKPLQIPSFLVAHVLFKACQYAIMKLKWGII